MEPVPCPFPVAKLPKFVRPWPATGDDGERMKWLGELEHAARASGRGHFAEFCLSNALAIAGAAQQREIKRLEKKLAEKTVISEERAAEIVERVLDSLRGEIAADLEKRLAAAVAQIELRFKQQSAWEDAVVKRIGEQGKALDQFEARLSEQEWRTR